MSIQGQAAKLIRKELKQYFPDIKFFITSKDYSGGNRIMIEWIFGPTKADIEMIVNKYKEGIFNPIEDIYEYKNYNDDIPRVKYILLCRYSQN